MTPYARSFCHLLMDHCTGSLRGTSHFSLGVDALIGKYPHAHPYPKIRTGLIHMDHVLIAHLPSWTVMVLYTEWDSRQRVLVLLTQMFLWLGSPCPLGYFRYLRCGAAGGLWEDHRECGEPDPALPSKVKVRASGCLRDSSSQRCCAAVACAHMGGTPQG